MNHLIGFVPKTVGAALVAAAVLVSPALGQGGGAWGGGWGNGGNGRYLEGFGQAPLLGVGVGLGPTTYGLGYGPFPVAPLGYGRGYGEGYGWRRGYPPYAGRRYRPNPIRTGGQLPAPAVPAAAPYLTNQTYEPGDGHRYPLYYDPVNRRYVYYPVAR